jgi:hypothetical protein
VNKLEVLQSAFGNYSCEGHNYLFFCPSCSHHKPKLSINIEKGVYRCWVCGQAGSIDWLIKKYANRTQRKYWQEITGKVDFAIANSIERAFLPEIPSRPEEISLPEGFMSLTHEDVHILASEPMKYLHSRGIGKKEILRWRMGFCSEGKYKNRVIIPSIGADGKINYFVGRNIGQYGAHYLSPAEISKDMIIFNELDIDWREPVTLVEGVFDAIKAGENAIPMLGSVLAPKTRLFQELIQHNPVVYVSLDANARRKEGKVIKQLLEYDVRVYKVGIPASDPGELPIGEFSKYKSSATLMNSSSVLLSALGEIT